MRMFPTLEMAPPKAVTAPSSSSGRRGPAKKLHQPAPRGSVESRQLPGLLKTTKPSILPTTSANDISVMVGFNAASVQFDGELPQYSEDILMKTRARASKQAGLSLNDVGEYAAENMEVKDPASPDHDGPHSQFHPIGYQSCWCINPPELLKCALTNGEGQSQLCERSNI